MAVNNLATQGTWAPSQYPERRLSVRSRKVSKPWDLYLDLPDRSEIWQALRQPCCRCACQISKRYDDLKYKSRGFETLRDLTKKRLFGDWDGAQDTNSLGVHLVIPIRFLSAGNILVRFTVLFTWWHHQRETFSALLSLCGEFTGDRWIPLKKASGEEFWCFLWFAPEQTVK